MEVMWTYSHVTRVDGVSEEFVVKSLVWSEPCPPPLSPINLAATQSQEEKFCAEAAQVLFSSHRTGAALFINTRVQLPVEKVTLGKY